MRYILIIIAILFSVNASAQALVGQAQRISAIPASSITGVVPLNKGGTNVAFTQGTSQYPFGDPAYSYPAAGIEFDLGSTATPTTAEGAALKVSRTEAITSTAACGGDPDRDPCHPAIYGISRSNTREFMQTVGAFFAGVNSNYGADGLGVNDALGISTLGRVTATGNAVHGWGAFLSGRRENNTESATGAEIRSANKTSSNCAVSLDSAGGCDGILLAAEGSDTPATPATLSYAVHIGRSDNNAQWDTGIGFQSLSVKNNLLDESATSVNGISLRGSHTYALITGANAGSVGIGTLTPVTTLDVNGAISVMALNGLSFPTSDNHAGNSVAVGPNALVNFTGTKGDFYNTGVGLNCMGGSSGNGTSAAIRNTCIGAFGLNSLTSGSRNTALGYDAGTNLTTATDTVLLGNEAGRYMKTGGLNVAVGSGALLGDSVTAANNTGASNTAIGYHALNLDSSGGNNTALGWNVGSTLTTGSGNLLLGYNMVTTTATASYEGHIGYNGNDAITLGQMNTATPSVTFSGAVTMTNTPLAISSGGTGAASATNAASALGLATNASYYFAGCAANQIVGDAKFYDYSGVGNDAVLGANLSNANAFTNVGYLTTITPTGGATDSTLHIPSLNFDYNGGQKLVVWWLEKAATPGSTKDLLGDGYNSTYHGIDIRATSSGKFNVLAASATNYYSSTSNATVFDGNLHSLGFVLDGQNQLQGLWVDEVPDPVANPTSYLAFNAGSSIDTTNANTFNIGTSVPASANSTVGWATQTRAIHILRLPSNKSVPSLATMTGIFKQIRENPCKPINSLSF